MSALSSLADHWELEAETLDRYHDERGAAAARLHAVELREAIRSDADELLTPGEAEGVSGYAKRTLRELVAEGKLTNHGRKGSPRFKRGELPSKPRTDDGFDAVRAARGLPT